MPLQLSAATLLAAWLGLKLEALPAPTHAVNSSGSLSGV